MMALVELKKFLKINLLIFLYSRSSERAERACQTSYAPPRKNITFLNHFIPRSMVSFSPIYFILFLSFVKKNFFF